MIANTRQPLKVFAAVLLVIVVVGLAFLFIPSSRSDYRDTYFDLRTGDIMHVEVRQGTIIGIETEETALSQVIDASPSLSSRAESTSDWRLAYRKGSNMSVNTDIGSALAELSALQIIWERRNVPLQQRMEDATEFLSLVKQEKDVVVSDVDIGSRVKAAAPPMPSTVDN